MYFPLKFIEATCSFVPLVKPEFTIEADQVLIGQVTKVIPAQGLFVGLPMHKCGLVALTDLRDSFVENPVEGFKVSQLVR